MLKFDLSQIARRNSKRPVVIRPIKTTRAQADDLALIYLKVVSPWEAVTAHLVEIYARTLEQKLRTDSVEELGGSIDEMATALTRLVLELDPSLKRWALRTEEWHRGKWRGGVLDAANVDLETLLSADEVRETIAAFLQRNTALIRNVSDETRSRIADLVFRGFQERKAARDIAKQIREATDMARARSIRIASDQTVKLASALDAERQRQAGLSEWLWRHSGKLHFRPAHLARNGNIYTDETAPADLPGQLPYCGCIRQGVLTFE